MTAASVEVIARWLGAPEEAIAQNAGGERYLVAGWESGTDTFRLIVRSLNEPDRIVLVAPAIAIASPSDTPPERLLEILTALAEASYEDPLCAWGYDPTEGEIRLTVAQISLNAELSEDMFWSLLNHTKASVEAMAARLRCP